MLQTFLLLRAWSNYRQPTDLWVHTKALLFSSDHVSNEAILDLIVLVPIMKNEILIKFYTTLVIKQIIVGSNSKAKRPRV